MKSIKGNTTDSIEELIAQIDNGDYSQFEDGEYFAGNGFKEEQNKNSDNPTDFHV